MCTADNTGDFYGWEGFEASRSERGEERDALKGDADQPTSELGRVSELAGRQGFEF